MFRDLESEFLAHLGALNGLVFDLHRFHPLLKIGRVPLDVNGITHL
jgi:hypothetical protein